MLSKQTPCYAIVIAIIKVDSIISVFMGFCGMFFRISCMNSFFAIWNLFIVHCKPKVIYATSSQ